MFIKLIRLDGKPIWLNAGFIVTVEPRRDGRGSVVVPIGDGLDYDVRESPEEVLQLLDGVPAPTVVPVPVSDCLAPTPPDVSPEAEPSPAAENPGEDEVVVEEKPTAAEKAKRSRRRTTKPKAESAQASAKPTAKLELSDDQIVRLAKLAPKSIGKLKNTLLTQFHVADVVATVQALVENGALTLNGNHIVWPPPAAPAEPAPAAPSPEPVAEPDPAAGPAPTPASEPEPAAASAPVVEPAPAGEPAPAAES